MADQLDIDMDLDLDCSEHRLSYPAATPPHASPSTAAEPILSHPNDSSDARFMQPLPHKVHLRGLEILSTPDIQAFAHHHFPQHEPSHIEWIDDTSANLVYPSASIGLEALASLTGLGPGQIERLAPLQTAPTKPCPDAPPPSILHARLAVFGDRKQSGARQRSRFYLLHPEYDPAERRKRDDTRRRSRPSDRNSLQRRARSNRRRPDHSLSSSDAHPRSPAARELFPDPSPSDSRRLRQRSASPARRAEPWSSRPRRPARDAKSPAARELFPQKCLSQPCGALGATDTPVASLNDSQTDASRTSRVSRPLEAEASRSKMQRSGAAAAFEFAIKGAASGVRVKELFPDALASNSGKELFAGRAQRRKTAKDLFC